MSCCLLAKDWKIKKHFLEAMKYSRTRLLKRCFIALRQCTLRSKQEQGLKWHHRHNRLKLIYQKQIQLEQNVFSEWRRWAHTRALARDLLENRNRGFLKAVFKAFRDVVQRDRQLKIVCLQRWILYQQGLMLMAFRAWHVYARTRASMYAKQRTLMAGV